MTLVYTLQYGDPMSTDQSNAQLAVEMYDSIANDMRLSAADAWKGIAVLLLSCRIWVGRWKPFHDVVVFRESNDFKLGKNGTPNACLVKAARLTDLLATELGIDRAAICDGIGRYWSHRRIKTLQPHNLVGHAFRSLVRHCLEKFGSPAIRYEEEVDPIKYLAGYNFPTRSRKPSIDIVALKGNQITALITTRWRYRHDRVDVVDEALAYTPSLMRTYPGASFVAVVGEFSAARLAKVLKNSGPSVRHGPITATVHFEPRLISLGLGENGRVSDLRSLHWLIDQTQSW
jgi:hypothetical protein